MLGILGRCREAMTSRQGSETSSAVTPYSVRGSGRCTRCPSWRWPECADAARAVSPAVGAWVRPGLQAPARQAQAVTAAICLMRTFFPLGSAAVAAPHWRCGAATGPVLSADARGTDEGVAEVLDPGHDLLQGADRVAGVEEGAGHALGNGQV